MPRSNERLRPTIMHYSNDKIYRAAMVRVEKDFKQMLADLGSVSSKKPAAVLQWLADNKPFTATMTEFLDAVHAWHMGGHSHKKEKALA